MIDITQYLFDTLISEGLLVILACYVLGNVIVKALPKINNNHTVPILSIAGAALVIGLGTFPTDPVGVRLVKGFILGWSSTGLHEFLKAFVRLGYIKIPGYMQYSESDDKKENQAEDIGNDPGG